MAIFIFQIVFILLEQTMNLNVMKKYVKINIFMELLYQLQKNNILKFNQYMKSDITPYIIYTDLESLIKKNNCKNNPKTFQQQK